MTIVVDSWGTSDLNPWLLSGVSFLGDYHNLRLMMQDPNGDLAPAWATEYTQTPEGITLKLNPKAVFADGTPADAEALKTNLDPALSRCKSRKNPLPSAEYVGTE
jgi:ABC-type transport system substrate-binding protein